MSLVLVSKHFDIKLYIHSKMHKKFLIWRFLQLHTAKVTIELLQNPIWTGFEIQAKSIWD